MPIVGCQELAHGHQGVRCADRLHALMVGPPGALFRGNGSVGLASHTKLGGGELALVQAWGATAMAAGLPTLPSALAEGPVRASAMPCLGLGRYCRVAMIQEPAHHLRNSAGHQKRRCGKEGFAARHQVRLTVLSWVSKL